MYLSAAVLTIGLMICSSAWKKSDDIDHFEPSHVWIRAQVEPMWSAHEVEIGRSTPAKPSAPSFFWSSDRFSRPQRTCSAVMTLPLPKRSWARRTPSIASIWIRTPRVYRTEPTSSRGPVPWPLSWTYLRMSWITFGDWPEGLSASALYPLAPSPTSFTSGSAPAHQTPYIFSRG